MSNLIIIDIGYVYTCLGLSVLDKSPFLPPQKQRHHSVVKE